MFLWDLLDCYSKGPIYMTCSHTNIRDTFEKRNIFT